MTRERRPLRWLHLLGLGKPRPDESAALEVEHHLAELTDRLIAEGLNSDQARREAERHFGDRARYAAKMRRLEEASLRGDRWATRAELLWQSVVSAGRTARREPGFTGAVVLTLGLGIGANATMYGIIDRLLLSAPEHIERPDELRRLFAARLNARTGEVVPGAMSYPDYESLESHGGMSVAGYRDDYEHTIGSGLSAIRAKTHLATAEFFPLLGVQPRLGRFFATDEAVVGAPLTVVLSEDLWRRAYGADPGILGRTLEIDGHDVPVVGVAPARFTGVDLRPVDIWLPLAAWSSLDPNPCLLTRTCAWMAAVARLEPSTTEEAAAEEATRLHRSARVAAGEEPPSSDPTVMFGPLVAARGPNPSTESRVAAWLAGVSVIVLLVACANVANLLLVRAIKRRREVAVRRALGVSRARLVYQSVLDTLVLALLGGAFALAFTWWGGSLIRSTLLPEVWFSNSAVSWKVIAYTALVASVVGLLAGVVPAIAASGRFDVRDNLASGSRTHSGTRSRLRGVLTIAQAAMCVVLLVGAGLFVRSLVVLRGIDLGLDTDRLIMADLEFTTADPDPALVTATYRDAMRAVGALPEVASTSLTATPFGVSYVMMGVRTPTLDSLPRLPNGGPYLHLVSEGYFETAGLALRAGRAIEAGDVAGAEHVAVVSETMAAMVWPGQRAVGQCLIVDRTRDACTRVVGVVEDAGRGGYTDGPHMGYYLSMAQLHEILPRAPESWGVPFGFYVRPRDSVRNADAAVAAVLRNLSPAVRWARVIPLDDTLWRQARSWTLGATMFTVFGLLALVVAGVGLYGVLAFDVAQRTREIGIRSALGARKARLLGGVISQGAGLGAIGIALGLAGAYFTAPYVQDLLFETSPRDPAVFATVALVLLVVCVAASLTPALRATHVDPVTALRAE